jgi:hypothetical protein
MPWQPWTQRPATRAAARVLITDAARSDQMLAIEAGVSTSTIALIRGRLEALGAIERIPAAQRTQRPRPRNPQSPTARAIADLGPSATPRAVAALASVSVQAASKALARLRPRLADAAAASDSIQVTRMPRQLADPAAASDRLTVLALVTCDCGVIFTAPSRARPPRRFCSRSCADAYEAARSRAPRVRAPDPAHHPPPIPDYPPPPDWSRATCTTSGFRYWTSDDREERAYASVLCQRCPVLDACARWSLCLPVVDTAVYAGMSQAERLRRKRAAMRELAKQAVKGIRR